MAIIDAQALRNLRSEFRDLNLNICERKKETLKHFGIDDRDLCESVNYRRAAKKNDRFLVNLFSLNNTTRKFRPSTTKCNSIIQIRPTTKTIIKDIDKMNDEERICKNNKPLKRELSMEEFGSLKDERDKVCEKIDKLSRIVKIITNQHGANMWNVKLQTEKLLLLNEQRFNSLMSKIRCNYEDARTDITVEGAIKLSSFKFRLGDDFQARSGETDFFILLLSHGLSVKQSKIERVVDNCLVFNEEFRFSFQDDVSIKLQVFHLKMVDTSLKGMNIRASLRKKKSPPPETYKLLYNNIYTLEAVEREAFRTSFKLCAETEIFPCSSRKNFWELSLKDAPPAPLLQNSVHLKIQVEDLLLSKRKSGFLTYGYKYSDCIVWNRRWCTLNGDLLNIYNSPTEEELDFEPLLTLNLSDCADGQIREASRCICPRTRSFLVNVKYERGQRDFYFFRADSVGDLRDWLSDLNSVLTHIKRWKEFEE